MSQSDATSPDNSPQHSDNDVIPQSERRTPVCSGCKQPVKGHRQQGLQAGPHCTGIVPTSASQTTSTNLITATTPSTSQTTDTTTALTSLQEKETRPLREKTCLLQKRERRVLVQRIQDVSQLRVEEHRDSAVQLSNPTQPLQSSVPDTSLITDDQITLDNLRRSPIANQMVNAQLAHVADSAFGAQTTRVATAAPQTRSAYAEWLPSVAHSHISPGKTGKSPRDVQAPGTVDESRLKWPHLRLPREKGARRTRHYYFNLPAHHPR